jgi:O-antigen ligase
VTLIRILMVALVIVIPNQLHLPEAIAKGVNPLNLVALLAVIALFRLPRPVGEVPPAPLTVPILMLCTALVWAFVVGVTRDASQWVGDLTALKNSIFFPLMFFFFYHAIRDKTSARIVFAALIGVATLAGLEAIREGLDYGALTFEETKRAAGPFGPDYKAANLAAVFFCMFFPLSGAVALFLKGRLLLRAMALGGAMVLVFGTFFTYSRQAFFILALITAALALRRNPLLAVVITVALASYSLWVPDAVVERIGMTEQGGGLDYTEQRFDASTESRFTLWTAAWEMFRDHPAGVGLEHFKREVGAYAPNYAGMDAHNFYMLFLAEGGLPGIVLLVGALLGVIAFAWRIGQRLANDESRVLAVAFQLSLLATLLGNVYGSRLLDGPVSGNFWVLAAVVARWFTLESAERPAAAGHAARGDDGRRAAPKSTRLDPGGRTFAGSPPPGEPQGARAPAPRGPDGRRAGGRDDGPSAWRARIGVPR